MASIDQVKVMSENPDLSPEVRSKAMSLMERFAAIKKPEPVTRLWELADTMKKVQAQRQQNDWNIQHKGDNQIGKQIQRNDDPEFGKYMNRLGL